MLKFLGLKKDECLICLEAASEAGPLLSAFSVSGNDEAYCNHLCCASCWQTYLKKELVEKAKRASPVLLGCVSRECRKALGADNICKLADAETRTVVEAVLAAVPDKHPQTLADLGYTFDRAGHLVTQSGGPFHFVTQLHYDALGDLVAPYIQSLMVQRFGLIEVELPLDEPSAPVNNIFMTPDALTCERLLLLVQGSGAVRAGQWARAVCINDSLEMGSVLPYVVRARRNGLGVIVFNPNLNACEQPPRSLTRAELLSARSSPRRGIKRVPVPGSETPVAHVLYVWDRFVAKARARDLLVVAHSAGGHGTVELLRQRPAVFERLRAIAFTDSVHSVSARETERIKAFFEDGHAQNWVQSALPLDTPIERVGFGGGSGCPLVSAGHEKHEYTSPCAIESVFAFLCAKVGVEYHADVDTIDYSSVAPSLAEQFRQMRLSDDNDASQGDAPVDSPANDLFVSAEGVPTSNDDNDDNDDDDDDQGEAKNHANAEE